jgi:hypothetical protein
LIHVGGNVHSRRAEEPAVRPLKVFAFDPSKGRNLDNFMTFQIPYEKLETGPIGEYVAVIDYDASNDVYYQSVDLDSAEVLIRGGLDPSESDPRFHQQMVYAVVSETIRRFEFALGRKVHWRRAVGKKGTPHRRHLRIFPHAFQEANAFYDPELRALLFGYFPAESGDVGSNLPGQTIFTCLSHDIIVHETTHALIDGLRDQFTEPTNVDVSAFHEAFADIIALFQHFSFKEALIDTIRRSRGLLYRATLPPDVGPGSEGATIRAEVEQPNPLVDLARQFGEAMGMRAALRGALGKPPDPRALDKIEEPHERGSILRISRSVGGEPEDELHPDLADRLAKAASSLAAQFVTICVRALDYCPPVDLRYGEFLRALITADFDLAQEDGVECRNAFIEAFRARGVVPQGVVSYSEEALRWMPPDTGLPPCTGLDFDLLGERPDDAQRRNAVVLHRYATKHASALGLSRKFPIQAHSYHAIHRVSPRGIFVFDYVVEFLQKAEVPLDPKNPKGSTFQFRGGTTLLFDQYGRIRYTIRKRIENKQRLDEEREFHRRESSMSASAPFVRRATASGPNFAATHRGY